MKILKKDTYSVYIYPEDHAPPHCHIRYKTDGPESVVGIPLLNLIAGPSITKDIKNALTANLDKLTKTWDQLNPSKGNK